MSETWNDVFNSNNIDVAYQRFIETLTNYLNVNIPKVQIKARKNVPKHPWITKGILKSIKHRNRLYKKSLCNPTDLKKLEYRQYRNKLTHVIRTSKRMYYTKQFVQANDSSSKWKIVNDILKRGNVSHSTQFKQGDRIVSDPHEIANGFNNFFANIGAEQASKVKGCSQNFQNSLFNPSVNSIFFNSTNAVEVTRIVASLNSSHSTGHDEMNTHLLKNIIGSIIKPLVYIFNLSLSSGSFPSMMKISKVIPIYKKGDASSFTNYRPISILSCFSKILERLVYDRLYTFLIANKLLNNDQYGFRKFHSTEYAIVKLYDRVSSALTNHEHVIGVFMDLSKAFDTLDHSILLKKLYHYGIRGIPLDWFRSYLSCRSQYTTFNNAKSSMSSITCGVPQGSILGPLLFLIYVNDIPNVSTSLQYILFADDTNIFCSNPNLQTLVHMLNTELPKLSNWFKCNKLSLNLDKTNFIYFKSRAQKEEISITLKINSISIQQKKNTKFLGILIDECLSWHEHVRDLSRSLSRYIGVMYKLRSFVPLRVLLIIYNSFIHSRISYCNIEWANCKANTDTILRLQKRAVRLCTGSGYFDHTDPLFSRLKTLKITDIHFMQIAVFMYRLNKNELPVSFCDDFTLNRDIHNYPTRHSSDFHLFTPRTALAHKSIRYVGPDIWNVLPSHIRNCSTIISFKRNMKELLLSKYSS